MALAETSRGKLCAALTQVAGLRPESAGERGPRRNHYGSEQPHTLASVMRYVVVIMAIAFFLIWDGLYNQGRYLDTTVREMSRIVRYVTGGG